MNYTLNQSVNKFIQLRQQLREIIGQPKDQIQNKFTAKTTVLKTQGKEKSILGADNKNKQNINRQQKSQLFEQTQRKLKKAQNFDINQSIPILGKSSLLIKSKQQTLNQINDLLVKKQHILSEIQNQIMKQSKISKKQVTYESSLTQPQYFSSEKTVIKAPNLSNIRQERNKLRKKSII